jgi:hypothetical protein
MIYDLGYIYASVLDKRFSDIYLTYRLYSHEKKKRNIILTRDITKLIQVE